MMAAITVAGSVAGEFEPDFGSSASWNAGNIMQRCSGGPVQDLLPLEL